MADFKENFLKMAKSFKLDFIDVKILISCYGESCSVSQLQKQVGVAYKNLLPHIKKLDRLKMIIIKDLGVGKKKEIRTNDDFLNVQYFMFGIFSLWIPAKDLEKTNKTILPLILKFLEDNK